MLTEQELVARFDQVRRQADGSFYACCPAHDDSTPSLHLTPTPDRWLLHCFRGCEADAVREAAGLTWGDLFAQHGTARKLRDLATLIDTEGNPARLSQWLADVAEVGRNSTKPNAEPNSTLTEFTEIVAPSR